MTQKQKNIAITGIILGGGLMLLIFKGNIFQPANVNLPPKGTENIAQEEEPSREIDVKAFRFGYEPNVIKALKGEKIKINIENTDTLHGIRFPELGLAANDSLEITLDKTGEFIWSCNNFCGEGHQTMQGKLIVENSSAQNLNETPRQPVNQQQPNQVFFGDKGESLVLENGQAKISAAVFESQKALFYNVVLASGRTVYFFVVKDKNGKYRAAANACQVCFGQKKGFRQEGNEMVCNNCGNRYPLEKIATEKGGCNPAPINPDLTVAGGKVIIKQTEIEEVAGLF